METWQLILIAIPIIFFLMFFLVSKVIGGMAATFVFGFLIRGFGSLVKLFFSTIAWIVRKIAFTSKDFSSKRDNENIVWNIQAIASLLLSFLFLLFTPLNLLKVYQYENKGWLFIAVIGLFSILTGPKIATAPFMRKYNITKEWGSAISLFLTGLTTASAVVHLLFRFFYTSLPTFTLFISLLVYLGFIGYITYKLIDDKGLSTLSRLSKAMEKNKHSNNVREDKSEEINEGNVKEKFLDDKTPDFQLALSKPTKRNATKKPIILPEISRFQHMQLIGPTGTGKSIMGLNLATQDILNPNVGLIALEPTKDFVRDLKAVSKNIGRNYYFVDPSDENTEIINPLDGDDIDEIAEINAGAFVGYLGKNANEFYKNKQKNALRMAIKVAKVIKKDEATYDDLLDILRPNSGELRKKYINQIEDSRIRKDLEEYNLEFSDKKLFNQAIQNYNGLIDYLKELTTNKYMRKTICGKSTVQLREVFNNGDIILISTAYGKIKQLGFVLGRLIITMLQSETFARTELDKEVREKLPPMAVYIDEVQNFVSEPFGEIFAMARKAKLMMTIMHQGLSQLKDVSEKLEKEIFDNARQKVVFGGGDVDDAEMFAKRIGEEYEKVKSNSSSLFSPLQITQSNTEQLRFKMLPSEITNLPGFQTDTLEPAEVLLLLVIHNRIEPPQIGLVSPLPKSVFKEMEDESSKENTDKHNDNIIILDEFEEKSEKKQGKEDSMSNKDDNDKNESSDNDKLEKKSNIDIDIEDNKKDNQKPKKKRRKRGKRGKGKQTGNAPVEEDTNKSTEEKVEEDKESNKAINIEDEIIDEDDNFDDILLELTDSK